MGEEDYTEDEIHKKINELTEKGTTTRTEAIRQLDEEYGSKNYLREYAIKLLNRVIDECKDLTPEQTQNERYELDGDLHSEIYNFLVNHNLLEVI